MPAIPERKQQQLSSLIQTWAPHQLSQQEPVQRHHSDCAQHMVETHSLPSGTKSQNEAPAGKWSRLRCSRPFSLHLWAFSSLSEPKRPKEKQKAAATRRWRSLPPQNSCWVQHLHGFLDSSSCTQKWKLVLPQHQTRRKPFVKKRYLAKEELSFVETHRQPCRVCICLGLLWSLEIIPG